MNSNPADLLIITGDSLLGELLCLHIGETPGRSVKSLRENGLADITPPSHVLVDFRSSEGIGVDFVRDLLARWPETRCMVLSGSFPESLIRLFRRMRLSGLVDKNGGLANLKDALNLFLAGGFYLSPGLDRLWTADGSETARDLTSREIEILCLVAKGMKSPEIGRRLELSVKTVHNHRANMMRKVGVRNVAQLVNYAHQNYLVRSA